MRRFVLPGSIMVIAGCASALATKPADPAATVEMGAGVTSAPATPAAPSDASEKPARFKAELQQDNEFRLAFGDVQQLKVALDFQETRWGLLRVMVGPGLATVSSAGFNLERLYRAYRAASYYGHDLIIELWKDGAKIGEVTDAGVLIGPEFTVPR
jgi:hypothetical protein